MITLWWGCEQRIDLGSILVHPFTVVVKLESLNPKERVAYVFRKGKLLRTEECAGKMTAVFRIDNADVRVHYPTDEWEETRFEYLT